jgi:hypothetical protein
LRGVFQTFQASHNYSQSEQSLPFQSLWDDLPDVPYVKLTL